MSRRGPVTPRRNSPPWCLSTRQLSTSRRRRRRAGCRRTPACGARLAGGAVFALVDEEEVAVGILDEGGEAVLAFPRLGQDGDALGAEFLDGGGDVLHRERDAGVGTRVLFVDAQRERDGRRIEFLPVGAVFPDG